jgi:peroxiredoxin
MALAINDTARDFEAQTTDGKIKFHDRIGDKWVVLFSPPKDFTPVCTTELGYMAKIKPEFDKRGVKIIGLRSTRSSGTRWRRSTAICSSCVSLTSSSSRLWTHTCTRTTSLDSVHCATRLFASP